MNIKSAEFIKGITGTDDVLYDGKFQVAFLGRSNVGKSSLINSLAKKRSLARTSSTPGKTIRMDFFLINNSWYFVDFPGYGYAKRSPEDRDTLAKMILWYVQYSEVRKRLVVLIVDALVGLTEQDTEMIRILREHNVPHIVAANKVDKLSMGERDKALVRIRSACAPSDVIPFSSKVKERKEALEQRIYDAIASSHRP